MKTGKISRFFVCLFNWGNDRIDNFLDIFAHFVRLTAGLKTTII